MSKTLYSKIFDEHTKGLDGLLIIDYWLLHEVTSQIALESMRENGRKIPEWLKVLAVEDHNIVTLPDENGNLVIKGVNQKKQIEALRENAEYFGFKLFSMGDEEQGIVHVIAAEQGFVYPGVSMACGDSHTCTSGAFAALAFGIGESEVEHLASTGAIYQKKLKNMRITINGELQKYITAKDVILHIIKTITNKGGAGYAIEFAGTTIENFSMEERMTICNMATESGAKVGIIACDQTTLDYVQGRPMAPSEEHWEQFSKYALDELHSDVDAQFDVEHVFDATKIVPQVTWGTDLNEVVDITGCIDISLVDEQHAKDSLKYMDLQDGQKLTNIAFDEVYIGSCTNGRISDLREVAMVLKKTGMQKHSSIKKVRIVPGSGLVKKQAEEEGLDKIFIEAGFEWHYPGCANCLFMHSCAYLDDGTLITDELIFPGTRVASTTNRNFKKRQGEEVKTQLSSVIVATLVALYGYFINPIDVLDQEEK